MTTIYVTTYKQVILGDSQYGIRHSMLDDTRPYISVYKNSSVAQIRKWLLKSTCSYLDVLVTMLE